MDMGGLGENFDGGLSMGRNMRDDGYESRSGSDNFEGVSLSGGEDDQEAAEDTPQGRRKKYHRHTPHQIQELES